MVEILMPVPRNLACLAGISSARTFPATEEHQNLRGVVVHPMYSDASQTCWGTDNVGFGRPGRSRRQDGERAWFDGAPWLG